MEFLRLIKDVEGIIANNFYTFERLCNLEEIHIYGWAFSCVDIPYLIEIIKRNDTSKLKWFISWFNEKDKENAISFLDTYNIDSSLINRIDGSRPINLILRILKHYVLFLYENTLYHISRFIARNK